MIMHSVLRYGFVGMELIMSMILPRKNGYNLVMIIFIIEKELCILDRETKIILIKNYSRLGVKSLIPSHNEKSNLWDSEISIS